MKTLILASTFVIFFVIGVFAPAVKAEVTEVTAEDYCSAVTPAIDAVLAGDYSKEDYAAVMASVDDWSYRLKTTIEIGLLALNMYPMTVAMLGEEVARTSIGYDRCLLEVQMSNLVSGKELEAPYTGATDEQLAAVEMLFNLMNEGV